MSAIARDWGPVEAMPVDTGFNAEDRRRFERVDVRVEDILKKIGELTERFRDVEVDIDELRGTKADRSELSSTLITDHETRLRLVEANQRDAKEILVAIRGDLEPLKAWKIKQTAVFAVILFIVEVLAHVVFK